MKKTYVLDTNVILNGSNVLDTFEKCSIIIPFVVLEELDKHKTSSGELGANARSAIRFLDKLSERGDLFSGVLTEAKANICIYPWNSRLKALMTKSHLVDSPDNQIIITALAANSAKHKITLLSNDVAVRVKAITLGLIAENHSLERNTDDIDNEFSGVIEAFVSKEEIDAFYLNGSCEVPVGLSPYLNEYVHLICSTNEKQTALGKFKNGKIQIVRAQKNVAGITPRNMRQTMALDALMDPSITLVNLIGKAGCGKTLMSCAAAIEQAVNQRLYDKIILIKPLTVIGKDIGFLPGSFLDKVIFAAGSFLDNFYHIFPNQASKQPMEFVQHLMDYCKVEFSSMTFMRGRSLPKCMIIIDEAQNVTKSQLKTLLSRLGEGSKVVVMGDPSQIDDPKLDSVNNGLVHVINAFKDQSCEAHVTLLRSERSEFASLAADLL